MVSEWEKEWKVIADQKIAYTLLHCPYYILFCNIIKYWYVTWYKLTLGLLPFILYYKGGYIEAEMGPDGNPWVLQGIRLCCRLNYSRHTHFRTSDLTFDPFLTCPDNREWVVFSSRAQQAKLLVRHNDKAILPTLCIADIDNMITCFMA